MMEELTQLILDNETLKVMAEDGHLRDILPDIRKLRARLQIEARGNENELARDYCLKQLDYWCKIEVDKTGCYGSECPIE